MAQVSIIIPAFNEAGKVRDTILQTRSAFEFSEHEFEIIVVDDGSTDGTGREAAGAGARVITHPKNIGYGNSIRSGVGHARFPLIALTDADGTYPVAELPSMAAELEDRDLDMIVGARKGKQYHGSLAKRLARGAFKFLSEFATGERIPDINSGLRVIRKDLILEHWNILCGGFSFTTTITTVALLTSRFVDYRPIEYRNRTGKSKVKYLRDTLRAAQILVMAILLFNPIKLYILMGAGLLLAGAGALLTCLAFPALTGVAALASLFVVGTALLAGIGFSVEQRRAGQSAIRPPQHRWNHRASGHMGLEPQAMSASREGRRLVSIE